MDPSAVLWMIAICFLLDSRVAEAVANVALHLQHLDFDQVPDSYNTDSGVLIVCFGIDSEAIKARGLRDCRYVHDVVDVNITDPFDLILEETITWPTNSTQLTLVLRLPESSRKWKEFSYQFLHQLIPHGPAITLDQNSSGVLLRGEVNVRCLNGYSGPTCKDSLRLTTTNLLADGSQSTQEAYLVYSALALGIIVVILLVISIYWKLFRRRIERTHLPVASETASMI